jgi:integrase/recombinase XerD
MNSVGQTIFAFFEDHLKTQKGLRPGSIQSYRDTLKLFLMHVAATRQRPITRLILEDLSSERVLDFLRMIETTRKNHVSTRNQRLAALHTFYRYLAVHHPQMLAEAERVEAIPLKRTPPPQTYYLERDEIDSLFHTLPRQGVLALRDRALFMVLYNTGASESAGGCGSEYRRCRSRWPTARAVAWKGGQMEKLPAMAGNRRTIEGVDEVQP